VKTCLEHRNVDGTEQATKPDDFCSWGEGREEQMTLNEFVEELDVAIKQDGHDIYCDAETASMIKAIMSDSNLLHRLIKYIEDSKVYYSDGSLCSIGESIIGERVCDDILKYIDKIR